MDELDREVLAARLAAVFGDGIEPVEPGASQAAVGVIVALDRDVSGFLLTRRASSLARHAGQYALPGGVIDAGESVEEAVLRETEEEIGLRLSAEDVLGRLPRYATRSGFVIHPLVLWTSELGPLAPAAAEVAEVFHVPLLALAAPEVPILLEVEGSDRPLIQVPLGGERLIHAPTGAILYQFGEAVLAERYVDAQAFEEPRFAWR